MAEGPEVRRLADHLRRELKGKKIRRVDASRRWRARLGSRLAHLRGTRVTHATARGKYLLLEFSTGDVLLQHMRVWGHWTFSPARGPGRPKRPRRRLRVEFLVDAKRATLWDAPVVELLAKDELENHPELRAQGPDALARRFDRVEFLRRLEEPRRARQEIGRVLLDQRVVAGVGNMYKAEILFLCGLHPRTPVAALTRREKQRLARTVPRFLRRMYERPVWYVPASRRAEGRGRSLLRIYGRAGEPCPRCGARIQRATQGGPKRPAFWCLRCQPRQRRRRRPG